MKVRREVWAVILILLLAGAAAYVHVTTTAEEYSRYNIGWNGTSGFAGEELSDLRDLGQHPEETLLILAPGTEFTADEVGYCRAFLDAGGRIVVADEEGAANRFLTDLGSTMRVRPGNLASLERDHIDPGLFTTRVVGNASLFAGAETVLVNRPAAVEGGDPVLETSVLTWDDADGDGRPGARETFGTMVVCAQEGNLTVLGDPSLFINAMLGENPRFIENLQPALIDGVHSRTGTKNPIINMVIWLQKTPPAAAAIVGLAILPVAYRFGRKEDE
ncbi:MULTISPECIES: DUF4350 domain-containing protein [Methanoculleus]|uniref:DUF4350 domain-containing protein n=1 Tax=Methanoculleus submarinus TaxID=204050 RepID=A0AAX3E589_9EURY|nr:MULTISPECIES: DUF4350 domain-containing protein [Methanoculleus]UYU17323.1 DUF4350 domain-containing protein [Methanoculleus submarinus]